MITLLLHISNAEPVKVDVEDLPHPSDMMIVGRNPRDRKDKEVEWLDEITAKCDYCGSPVREN